MQSLKKEGKKKTTTIKKNIPIYFCTAFVLLMLIQSSNYNKYLIGENGKILIFRNVFVACYFLLLKQICDFFFFLF